MANQVLNQLGRESYPNKVFFVKATVLSPVFIGGDNSEKLQQGFDFYVDKKSNKIKFFDWRKILRERDDIKRNFLQKWDFTIFKNHADSSEAITKIYDLPIFGGNTDIKEIRPFVCNGNGQPIVPGSSIKGALRGLLAKKFGCNRSKDFSDVFGGIDNNLMRLLRISDALAPETIIANSKILSLNSNNGSWTAGWKERFKGSANQLKESSFNTLYQCLKPGEEFVFEVSLFDAGKFKDQLRNKNKESLFNMFSQPNSQTYSLDGLLSTIKKHGLEHANKELKYIKEYAQAGNLEKKEKLIEAQKKIVLEAQNNVLIRLGANVGFHSITGDIHANDYVEFTKGKLKNKYTPMKTRKVSLWSNDKNIVMMPFGWVKLELVEKEAAKQVQQNSITQLKQAVEEKVKPQPKPTTIEDIPKAKPPFKDGQEMVAIFKRKVELSFDKRIFKLHAEGIDQEFEAKYNKVGEPGSLFTAKINYNKKAKKIISIRILGPYDNDK